MTDHAQVDLVVVGGGVSGLGAALWAASTGARVVVLEASGALGGKVVTDRSLGVPIEGGPDSFVTRHPASQDLALLLGSDEPLAHPQTTTAYIYSATRLHPLVGSLVLGVPADAATILRQPVLDLAGKARAMADLLTPPGPRIGDVSLAEAVGGRLGHQVLDRLAGPLIGGINAGSPGGLSIATVAPQVHEAWKEGGSLVLALGRRRLLTPTPAGGPRPAFATPRAGMAAIVDAATRRLGTLGVEIRLDEAARSVRPEGGRWEVVTEESRWSAAGVVLATPARASAALLADGAKEVAHHLSRIESAGVVVTTLVMDESDLARPLDGSGFLVARDERRLLTACTWSTAKWPHLAERGVVLLRASAGRDGDSRALGLDDATLVRSVLAELADAGVLRPEAQPKATVVHRWPDAFPQYRPGHLQLVASVDQATRHFPGLGMAGAWRGGIGVPACWASGRSAARRAMGDGAELTSTERHGGRP